MIFNQSPVALILNSLLDSGLDNVFNIKDEGERYYRNDATLCRDHTQIGILNKKL